eukprot:CAMPEP_0175881154 /NCGR_PEP_ID=MMETSP0107_2-20121207/42720_1 /TAXON_ID=195067 ORGANISM="Goniomonas pacifica, Strain CCMP1869" /NCGR_SAMPLE_ID=MMETSP0107_2 /ASSEMBLY_ACC=CAM_ASM_000203 /LENGTH=211 /DNA_ID=CAMNT_0017200987 /DNA_START=263 /DNA_END=898 /DNA_ORIENTATION=+
MASIIGGNVIAVRTNNIATSANQWLLCNSSLDGVSDVIEGDSGLTHSNPSVQCELCHARESPCLFSSFANNKSVAAVSVIAVQENGAVDLPSSPQNTWVGNLDHISIFKGAIVGNAMTNNLIHRGADTSWEPHVVDRRRIRISCAYEFMHLNINLFCRHSSLNERPRVRQSLSSKLTSRAHFRDCVLLLDLDGSLGGRGGTRDGIAGSGDV